jgi:hypothetical protein
MTPDERDDETDDLRDSKDDDAMRALLKKSMGARDEGAPAPPALLRGVQKRIRTRSQGKFFSDGWSTSEPRVSYVLIAIVMLLVVGVAYLVLGPAGVTK